MAFIVEDGTGVTGANSYVSVAEYISYWADRNIDYSTLTDAEIQALLIDATLYVDSLGGWGGYPEKTTQGLQFPRLQSYDCYNRLIVDVPERLKYAVCEASKVSYSGVSLNNTQTSSNIKKDKVDVIETEYFQNSASSASSVYIPSVEANISCLRSSRYGNGIIVRY